jgi:hypothetical protein
MAKTNEFYIYPDSEDYVTEVEEAWIILPCDYVNHTDFDTRRNHPIALSI